MLNGRLTGVNKKPFPVMGKGLAMPTDPILCPCGRPVAKNALLAG